MTASLISFPKSPTVIPIRQQIANLAVMPAPGSTLIFLRDGKLGAGEVIVPLPSGQIMVKVDEKSSHPQAGNKIWISRREVRTHAIFQRPPSELTAPPADTTTDPDDFPPAAA